MVELEKWFTLTAKNFYNFGVYYIIKVFSIVYIIYVIPKN